jgi:hypothetical protein
MIPYGQQKEILCMTLSNPMIQALPGPKKKEAVFSDFFPPVKIPVIPHTPWVGHNFPIPLGLSEEVCSIVQKKIAAGIYEPLKVSMVLCSQERWKSSPTSTQFQTSQSSHYPAFWYSPYS